MSVEAQKETLGFQTEVKQILNLVINALYSNKEIFLRELISNASDAVDKLRFEALSDAALYENDPNLQVKIYVDKQAKTLTISDNGIGMSRAEIIDNIGTIAKSGTKAFLESLSGEKAKDAQLIGQFGVGFYSAFIVADKVIVESRRAGMTAEQGVRWESSGEGTYVVENINKPERGTQIILHLKADEEEFLEDARLRTIVHKYSDHIPLPILMPKLNLEEKENAPVEYETVNKATAMWTLPKSEIKDEEYQDFYKHISHDFANPLTWSHNKVEGKQQYITLLYIPEHAPFDLWQREFRRGLKLYVQRVFIMDNAEQFLPAYLRFVKGVVDSSDLPLNISREILQHNRTIETIRTGVVKRVLSMLEKLAEDEPEKYNKFWAEFGQVIKEGPAEDFANKDQIAKLLRFSTTTSGQKNQDVSLDDYIKRMKPDQDKIYYLTAETFNAAKDSPLLEIFRKKDIEVLLLSDRVDEWLVAHLTEYAGKTLQSIAKGEVDLDNKEDEKAKEEQKETEKNYESFIAQMKKALGEKAKDVRITYRLTDSPACVVADENDLSGHMSRLLKAAGQVVPTSPPIFEVNPEHPLIKRLKDEQDDQRFNDWSELLFEQAMLIEEGKLDEPAHFVRKMNQMLLSLV